MSSENIFHETRDLPTNVLTLVDDSFYAFVEQRLGVYQSMLLKIQQINSVPCFLLTNDPCEILNLNIKDDDLDTLKTKICFPLLDGSFIVKPGFKTGFTCLRDVLSKRTEQQLKQVKGAKPLSTITNAVNIIPMSLPSSTPPMTIERPTTETTVSLAHNATLTSITEHRRYFINLLEAWCFNHKEEFMSESFNLQEGTDFVLNILYDQNSRLKTSVKCTCGTSIILTMKEDKIQLSNYQKHLRSTKCSHMRAVKKMNERQNSTNLQQSTNTISSLTSKPSASMKQELASQSSASVSTNASPTAKDPSADTQPPQLQPNARKRGHSSLQLASSQKTKKNRI